MVPVSPLVSSFAETKWPVVAQTTDNIQERDSTSSQLNSGQN